MYSKMEENVTYVGLETHYVGVESEVVFGYVELTLDEDVSLQGTDEVFKAGTIRIDGISP